MRFVSGLPETECGYGSTLTATAGLRDALPAILARLGVASLLDAPCGDFNWLSRVDLGPLTYIGVDISAANLAKAKKRAPDRDFRAIDIMTGGLPRADAVLARDFFQHLPNAMALAALVNFRRSGARWLLATSFDGAVNTDIDNPGEFRPLNLEIAPFGLGAPVEAVADGPGRVLGVWRI